MARGWWLVVALGCTGQPAAMPGDGPDAGVADAGAADAGVADASAVNAGADATPVDARPPAPRLETGAYRLEMTNSFFWSPGPRLSLAADGSFTGHPEETLFECAGRYSAGEHAALTDALNAADVMRRTSSPSLCADHPIYHLDIQILDGERNQFTYEACPGTIPELDAVIDAAIRPLRALRATGACTNCPVETRPEECYLGNPLGSGLVCVGSTRHDCDADHSGDVIDCGYPGSFECLPEHGYGPALVWTIRRPRLWRWHEEGESALFLRFAVEIEVENRGHLEQELRFYDHWRFEDPTTGDVVPRLGTGVPFEVAGPHSQEILDLSWVEIVSPELLVDVTALQVRIRERPWDVLPYGPPVPVEIIDADPFPD